MLIKFFLCLYWKKVSRSRLNRHKNIFQSKKKCINQVGKSEVKLF